MVLDGIGMSRLFSVVSSCDVGCFDYAAAELALCFLDINLLAVKVEAADSLGECQLWWLGQ